ncbi:unnamed protein product [Notodromas monacha]|uniref:40S ribosomal protein S12 n=1 Tax=Notodromas monacha TaxID=399045 RepID=A0A7R9G915_9CRUS|nr:unnamed protein product [Notodromas monacha]CAG0913791.1 unnamed protein product [Notodromas monacha]
MFKPTPETIKVASKWDNAGRQALLCVLANSCDEELYKKLVTALCSEHGIPLLHVDSNKMLGEWSGLCKIDKEGKARKVVGSSCVVITDWGKETPALDFLKDHMRQKGRQALLCVLANSCDEELYKKLVTALCSEHGIPLLHVDSNKMLGEWSGLCKIDKEGKARKVVGSSCVVITDWGKETPALDFLKDHMRQKGADFPVGIMIRSWALPLEQLLRVTHQFNKSHWSAPPNEGAVGAASALLLWAAAEGWAPQSQPVWSGF